MPIRTIDPLELEGYRKLLLSKAMPPNSLGRLSELALELALITPKPLAKAALLLFAADHGVVEEGVTHSPVEITYQQCRNFANGGGACALFAALNGVQLWVIDVGVNHAFSSSDAVIDGKVAWGSRNMLQTSALEEEACRKAMACGVFHVDRIAHQGFDTVAFGEMGVGNTTSASCIASALTGLDASLVTGRGSGLGDAELNHKIGVVRKALAFHPEREPYQVLINLGGYEIAAIAGGMIRAAELGLPILLDGFVVTAAALIAVGLEPAVSGYLVPCHRSGMQGHQAMLEYLGCAKPLLDLGMQLGEGTGALVAWPLVRLASHILGDMTSFEEGGVTDSTALLKSLGVL